MLKLASATITMVLLCCCGEPDKAGNKPKEGAVKSVPPCACLISECFDVEDPPDYAVYLTEVYRNEDDCINFDIEYYTAPKGMGNQICGEPGSCTESPTFKQRLKEGKVRHLTGIKPGPDFILNPPPQSPVKILLSRVATFKPKKNGPTIKARVYMCEHTHPKCHCVYGVGQEITGNLPVDMDHPQDVKKIRDGEYDVTYGTGKFRIFTAVDSD